MTHTLKIVLCFIFGLLLFFVGIAMSYDHDNRVAGYIFAGAGMVLFTAALVLAFV